MIATSSREHPVASPEGESTTDNKPQTELLKLESNPFRDAAESKYFVDKTGFIKYFHAQGNPIYFTAPRCFGKTTNLRMLQAFYEISVDANGNAVEKSSTQNYQIFSGLAKKQRLGETIFEDKAFFEAHFGNLPVVHFSFEPISVLDKDEFVESLHVVVYRAFNEHAYLLNSNKLDSTEKKFFIRYHDLFEKKSKAHLIIAGQQLTSLLFKHHQKPCVILIDGFDSPVIKHVMSTTKDSKETFRALKEFTENTIGNRVAVTKVFFTGETSLGKLYLPPDTTHHQFTESAEMSPFFGFTKEEVLQIVLKDVKDVKEEDYKMYGGYRGENVKEPLWNTHSIVQFAKTNKADLYWKATIPIEAIPGTISDGDFSDLIWRRIQRGDTIKLTMDLVIEDHIEMLRMFTGVTPPVNESHHLGRLAQFMYELGYLTDRKVSIGDEEDTTLFDMTKFVTYKAANHEVSEIVFQSIRTYHYRYLQRFKGGNL